MARASGSPAVAVAREAVGAVDAFSDDPQGMLVAFRRLLDRHPLSGPLWWLASTALTAPEPAAAARRFASELDRDNTMRELAAAVPDDATVCIVGWPETIASALVRRGDIEILAVNAFDEATGLARRMRASETLCSVVPLEGLASAVANADLLLLESSAIGPTRFSAVAPSFAAAATARQVGIQTWLVGGVGRVLTQRHWDALVALATKACEPWSETDEMVPLSVVDQVVDGEGVRSVDQALAGPSCPIAAELFSGS